MVRCSIVKVKVEVLDGHKRDVKREEIMTFETV